MSGAPSSASLSALAWASYHPMVSATSMMIGPGVATSVIVEAADEVIPVPEHVVIVEQVLVQLDIWVPETDDTAHDALHWGTPVAVHDDELDVGADVGSDVGSSVGSPSPSESESGGKSPTGGYISRESQGGGPPLTTGSTR